MGLALVYVAFFALRKGGPSGVEHSGVGKTLSGLTFEGLTVGEGTKSEEWGGKVTLINFWGTWCPPCRMEFPHIVQMHRRLKSYPDFNLVSVSSPSAGSDLDRLRAATAGFLEKSDAEFATYYDGDRSLDRLVRAAGLPSSGIPITLVCDEQNVIRGVWQGYYPGTEVEIESLLSGLLEKESSEQASDEDEAHEES